MSNLSPYYSGVFCQNENTGTDDGEKTMSIHYLQHTPIINATTTGTIYCLDKPVQTFVANEDGSLQFRDIGLLDIKVLDGELDLETGELKLEWSNPPGDNFALVNYEYECESFPEPKIKKVPDGFIMPTFETFFTHEQIQDMSDNACTVCCWDFNTCLGDTIKEKYESLYVKLHEMTSVLVRKGAKGYFWIVCSDSISSVIQTCTAGFNPSPSEYYEGLQGQYPLGMECMEYTGLLNGKWRIYTDMQMTYDSPILIGCNDRREEPQHYGRINVANFF